MRMYTEIYLYIIGLINGRAIYVSEKSMSYVRIIMLHIIRWLVRKKCIEKPRETTSVFFFVVCGMKKNLIGVFCLKIVQANVYNCEVLE